MTETPTLPSVPSATKVFVVTTKWGGAGHVPYAVLPNYAETKKYLSDNAANLVDPVWYTVPVVAPKV